MAETTPWYEEFGFGPAARLLDAPDYVVLDRMVLDDELETALGLRAEVVHGALRVHGQLGMYADFWPTGSTGRRLRVTYENGDTRTYERNTTDELVQIWREL